MKTFNAFQMVAGFAALPFGLSWVQTQTFPGQSIAFWIGGLIYIICFAMMIRAVRIGIDKWN